MLDTCMLFSEASQILVIQETSEMRSQMIYTDDLSKPH